MKVSVSAMAEDLKAEWLQRYHAPNDNIGRPHGNCYCFRRPNVCAPPLSSQQYNQQSRVSVDDEDYETDVRFEMCHARLEEASAIFSPLRWEVLGG